MKAQVQRWSAKRKFELLLLLEKGELELALTASCRSRLMHKEGIMRGIAVLGVAGLALVASGTALAQQAMIMGDMITASVQAPCGARRLAN